MIEHPWARATPTTSLSSVVYLTIVNNHGDDTLVHASTPIATMATLHQTRLDNGIMRMLPIEAIPIAEGERLMLKPGGYHIMLTGVMKPLKPGRSRCGCGSRKPVPAAARIPTHPPRKNPAARKMTIRIPTTRWAG
jgi:hypothetical protein